MSDIELKELAERLQSGKPWMWSDMRRKDAAQLVAADYLRLLEQDEHRDDD